MIRKLAFAGAALLAVSAHADTNDAPNAPISFNSVNPDTALAVPGSRTYPNSNQQQGVAIVKPNKLAYLPISVKDVNYMVCKNGRITDRTFSEEKPLEFKRGSSGEDAYLKLRAKQEQATSELLYYTENIDLYVVCDGEVYSMMLTPTMNQPQKIILDGGQGKELKANIAAFGHMPREEMVVEMIDTIHNERGQLPGTFHVKKAGYSEKWRNITPNTQAKLLQTVKLEGSGMTVYAYQMYSKKGDSLHEMDVVNAQLQNGVFGVRLYNHRPKAEQTFLGYIVTWEAM